MVSVVDQGAVWQRNVRRAGSIDAMKWSTIETMKDLPLNALRAFAAIHSCGGVRAAARELGIAHSSVSRHLAELEGWLGVELTTGAARPGAMFTAQGEALGSVVVA